MRVTIDKAGRIVVPKSMREELGLNPEEPLEIEVVDDHVEISHATGTARLVEGPDGLMAAPTGRTITSEEIRRILEAARERR